MKFDALLSADQLAYIVWNNMRANGVTGPSDSVVFVPLGRSAYIGTEPYDPKSTDQANRLLSQKILRPYFNSESASDKRRLLVEDLHKTHMGGAVGNKHVIFCGIYNDIPKTGAEAVAAVAGISPEVIEKAPASAAGFQNLELVKSAIACSTIFAARFLKKGGAATGIESYVALRAGHGFLKRNGSPSDGAIGEMLYDARLMGMIARGKCDYELFGFLPGPVVQATLENLRCQVALLVAGFGNVNLAEDEGYAAATMLANLESYEQFLASARDEITKPDLLIPGFDDLMNQSLENARDRDPKFEALIERVRAGNLTERERKMGEVLKAVKENKVDFSDPKIMLPVMAAYVEYKAADNIPHGLTASIRKAADINTPVVGLLPGLDVTGVSICLEVVMAERYLEAAKRFMPTLYAACVPERVQRLLKAQTMAPPTAAKN